MLQLGMNITLGQGDTLRKIQTADLVKFIRDGAFDLVAKTDQLRKIQSIDQRKYQEIKKFLPYVTGGIFHPPCRNKENFAFIDNMIFDFDHLSSKELSPVWLKEKLAGDERVEAIFISPGNDGIKVLLPLSHRITDPVKYTLCYKVFALQFAKEYGIEQVIDPRTSDVTRACFLCYDPEIYHNLNPLPTNPDMLVDFDSAEQVRQAESLSIPYPVNPPDAIIAHEEAPVDLTREKLAEIRRKLNPKAIIRPEKPVFVPEKLHLLEQVIREKAVECGLEIIQVKNIQYGKQIAFGLDQLKGELNIFYGKRGYTIVKSSKSGCSEEMNDLAYQLVAGIIY
ncbi:MAG: hypothetical protein K0B37_13020 [Bacteroidales bacterium]|nr:hypothetical protein [Bacteroidales bacterium]